MASCRYAMPLFLAGFVYRKIEVVILITGATGLVGRSLMRQLRRQDRPVRAYRGHLRDSRQLREQLTDVATVVHLASAESRNSIRQLRTVDVGGTQRLILESRRAGVQRIIGVSRLNANPNSHFALLRAKGLVERQIRQSQVPYTILRSATLFGQDDRFLNVIAGLASWSWPFVWVPGKGLMAMQPFWVEDLARCIVSTLDREDLIGETIELAGRERLRYQEIVRQVLLTAGMSRLVISPAVKLVRPISMLLFGWWRKPPVTRFFLDRFSVPEVAPLDAVLRNFGFEPSLMGQRIAYLRRAHPGLHLFRL